MPSVPLDIINRSINYVDMVSKRPSRKRGARRSVGRGRGRPPEESSAPDVRQALLDASRRLFVRRGFHEVGTREIASAAGVNPAMIHYYFGDKEGLYRAMLEGALSRLIGRVGEVVGAGDEHGDSIPTLLRLYVATLADDPWIPRLIIREVLSDGAPFREEFIERFASRAAELVPGLLRRQIDEKRLRSDLDPILATLSLVGMTIFPFLAYPVARRVFGIEIDADFRDRFTLHTTRLFLEGAGSEGSGS